MEYFNGSPFHFNEISEVTISFSFLLGQGEREIPRRNTLHVLVEQKTRKRILLFVKEYRASVPHLTNILISKWHLIENHPLLREIYKDPPLLSYRKGRSFDNVLVRAKR